VQVYRIPFSTNVERVALAAGHKGVAIDWVDVDPDDRSPVEQVSGQPLVPVLVHGDETLSDSPVILDWLEERFPEPPLYPSNPADRAEVQVFVDWFNKVWKRPPNLMDQELEKAEPNRNRLRVMEMQMQKALGIFENLLRGRDYLFGEFGMADVTAFPFLKYAVFGLPDDDEHRFHRILVEHQTLDAASPLRAWAERVDAHPRS
jgi:glutathione S-transferase